ncbi:MAG: hypothetical protein ACFFB3_03795, partial [Candidatus Hodarchaeota archaeon]
MDFEQIACPSEILASFSEPIGCFQPIKRHCDCDSPLGVISRRGGILSKTQLKKIRKRIRKTGEELARVIEQEKLKLESHPETIQWYNFLQELLSGERASYIGLYMHLTSKPLEIKEKHKLKQRDITKEALL